MELMTLLTLVMSVGRFIGEGNGTLLIWNSFAGYRLDRPADCGRWRFALGQTS